SPHLEDSRWVLEEIAFAGLASVGMLAVRWPERLYTTAAAAEPLVAETVPPDQRLRLADQGDLLGEQNTPSEQTLREGAEDRILEAVLNQRARAVRQRLMTLLPFAQQTLSEQFNVTPGERLGDLLLEDRVNRDRLLARVLPFRPTVESIHDLYA